MTETNSGFFPSFLDDSYKFPNADDASNGLCLNNVCMPQEIMRHIFIYVEPKDLLRYSLVCRTWNNLIKSDGLWATMYEQKCKRKSKKLPWYLYYCFLSTNYFDTNLIRNGNGEDGFNNWIINETARNLYKIENPPDNVDPLPLNVPEFNNKTSCFATAGIEKKLQLIKFENNKLFQYILDNYKPHIYMSEWIAVVLESCSLLHPLMCGVTKNNVDVKYTNNTFSPTTVTNDCKWEKMQILLKKYSNGIKGIIFHSTRTCMEINLDAIDSYKLKTAGGVVKFLFDTIEPLPVDNNGNKTSQKYIHKGVPYK